MPGGDTPPPDEDPAKWKAHARKWEGQAKANAEAAKRLTEIEDANKSEIEKATDNARAAEARAKEAELKALRLEVASDKGLTTAQAKRLMGDTREELEADADELVESFKPAETAKGTPPTGKPKPHLRGGGDPNEEPVETDPAKLAAAVSRGF